MYMNISLCMYCVLQGDDVSLIDAAGLDDGVALFVDAIDLCQQVLQLLSDLVRQGAEILLVHQGIQAHLGARKFAEHLGGVLDPKVKQFGCFFVPLFAELQSELLLR